MRILTVFLLLATAQANASALYKCEGPKKDAISIQSEPCTAGSTQIWMRDANSGQSQQPIPQVGTIQAAQRKGSKDAIALSQMNKPDIAVKDAVSKATEAKLRCKTAKEQAMVIRDRDRKMLNAKLASQLDAWVESECKAK